MKANIIYNICMQHEMYSQEYRTELIPRRGEFIAWITALMVLGAWFVLHRAGQPVLPVVPILGVLLLLAALSISLGNWMDRHTRLRLEETGISFHNGLRHVHLQWEQIQRVNVIPSNWGKKVQVIADHAYFEFRTLGQVEAQGRTLGRVGFEQGDRILEQILEKSHLYGEEHGC
jgi:hypothetical protein